MTRTMPATAMTASALKELYDRKCNVIGRRPSFARVTGQACVHLTEGFACDVHHEDTTLRADQPEADGGTGAGPHPGQLMRSALGADLAMGYRLWAARRGVRIDSVDIEITCETDVRGQLGLSDQVAVGWETVTFHVAIVSPHPQAEVRDLVETADRLSPMLANLSRAVVRTHRLTVIAPRGKASAAADSRTREGSPSPESVR